MYTGLKLADGANYTFDEIQDKARELGYKNAHDVAVGTIQLILAADRRPLKFRDDIKLDRDGVKSLSLYLKATAEVADNTIEHLKKSNRFYKTPVSEVYNAVMHRKTEENLLDTIKKAIELGYERFDPEYEKHGLPGYKEWALHESLVNIAEAKNWDDLRIYYEADLETLSILFNYSPDVYERALQDFRLLTAKGSISGTDARNLLKEAAASLETKEKEEDTTTTTDDAVKEVTDDTVTDEELFTLEDGTVYTYDELKEKVKSPEFQYPDEWDIASEVAKYCRDKKNHPESIPRADEMLDRYAVRGLAVYFDSSDTIAEALIKAYRLNHPTMEAPGKEAYEWMQNNVREYKKLSDDSKKTLQDLIYYQGELSWNWHIRLKRIDAAKNAIELDETIIRLEDNDRATHHHTIKIYLNHLYESDYLSYKNLEFLEDAAVHYPEYFKRLYEYKCIPRMHTSILDDDLDKLRDKQDCYFDVKREFFCCRKNNRQHGVFSVDGCINTTLSELFDLDEVLHHLELQHVKFDDITYLKEMFSIPMRDIELDEDWFTYHDIWTCHNRYRLYNDDEFHKRDAETILLQGLMRGLPLEYIAYLIRDKGFKRGVNIITDDVVEEVTDDNNKTNDVTVTKKNKEDNKMSTDKEVRTNDADSELPVKITETLIPMERFTLISKEYTNLIVDVYISPDFERGCAVLLDDEAVNNADAWLKFDFETDGLNPEAFGSVENMIESLVDSNGYIPQGMTVRRHLKGAILPTRYGDIYSAMDGFWGDLHVWIWRDGVMKSIDHVKLTVDYSNWQDAIEYILAENIADGLDLAAV